MSTTCPVIDFDHHRERIDTRAALTRELRSSCPVARTEQYGGFYVVSSFSEVRAVLADDVSFSVEKQPDGSGGLTIPANVHGDPLIPGEIDPPAHTGYRKPISPLFTRKAIERLRPKVEEITAACMDSIVERGEFDLVQDLGNVVPAATIIHYLGFPAEEREAFRLASDEAFGIGKPANSDDHGGPSAQLAWMYERISSAVSAKRAAPLVEDDVLSLAAHLPETEYTDAEIHGLAMNLLAGGIATTSALTSNAFIYMEHDRALRRRLITSRELIPDAIEEFLRMSTPAVGLARTVVKDVTIGDMNLVTGDRVFVVLPGANSDERQYVAPEEIDIERRGQHLAFGAGAHYCIGVHLARLEAQVIFDQVLERIPDYRIDLERAIPMAPGVLNGWQTMPATTGLVQ